MKKKVYPLHYAGEKQGFARSHSKPNMLVALDAIAVLPDG